MKAGRETAVPGARWLPLARAGWIAVVSVVLLGWVLGAHANAAEPLPVCAEAPCDPFSLSAEDMQVAQAMGLPRDLILGFWLATNFLMGLPFFLVAGVLFWRRSDTWIGLLVSFVLVFLGGLFFTENDDALWRAYAAARLPLDILFPAGMLALTLLWFTFPDGRIVPGGRAGRLAVLGLVLLHVPFGADPVRGASINSLIMVAATALGLAAQIYRYRRVSGPVQRQQTKWVLFGLAAAVAVMLLWLFTDTAFPPERSNPQRVYFWLILRAAIVILICALPVTIALSVVRYRLWDVDLLIRRTLIYAALTATLALVYFGSVVILQALFRSLTGQASQLAVVASTLAIAALFAPLRRRVQDFIDRRFYRRKYDAAQTLAAFAAAARDETDLDALAGRLVGVVEETMQPAHASLWLKRVSGATAARDRAVLPGRGIAQ